MYSVAMQYVQNAYTVYENSTAAYVAMFDMFTTCMTNKYIYNMPEINRMVIFNHEPLHEPYFLGSY